MRIQYRLGFAGACMLGIVGALVFQGGQLGLIDTALSEEIESNIARGGQLYDKWYAVLDVDGPDETHSAYPADVDRSGAGTWRCKECHGWDYRGADGAYSSGSHFTGITGVSGLAGGSAGDVAGILRDGTHGFTDDMLDDQDLADLGLFLTLGQFDMDDAIDRGSREARGSADTGEPLFNTLCAGCHGFDGDGIADGEPLGPLARGNPWETLHKILNGQPDEEMPSFRALDRQIAVDILAYVQTLPE